MSEKLEYQENLEAASRELLDAMGTEHFRSSDVMDIALSYSVDEEDLIFSLY